MLGNGIQKVKITTAHDRGCFALGNLL